MFGRRRVRVGLVTNIILAEGPGHDSTSEKRYRR